ncbi:MAG TPA: type II toxin-antitoxin system prevent-host-death family antitoxin [Thermoanaerobaculia bacterium]|nr:type II toxin-antitoxin system prevent-host-death family antitoxin [Thermoanaerobaculia bacterium]
MRQKRIDIQELREMLETRVEEVRDGSPLVITEGGKPVARLVPAAAQVEERLQQLLDSGGASWSGQKLPPAVPRIPIRGTKTIAELLLEDRD